MNRSAFGMGSVTVVVCTRDRARGLEACLRSLEVADPPPDVRWEVLVIDNGSGETTREAVRHVRDTTSLPLRYVVEERPGLSRARNRALDEARGEILAFTDDDCRVAPDWLKRLSESFSREPSPEFVCGRVAPAEGAGDRVPSTGESPSRWCGSPADLLGLCMGANMAFVRGVVDQVGRFDCRLGAGSPLHAAEDTDYLYRGRMAGCRVLFAPEVLVHHDEVAYHDEGNATVGPARSASASRRGYAVGRGAFYCKHGLGGDRAVLRQAGREIRRSLAAALRWRREGVDAGEARATLWHLLLGAWRWLGVRNAQGSPFDVGPNRRKNSRIRSQAR